MSIASQLSFSTATSVRGGALGSIPYQTATSSTIFVSIGAAGTVLTSSGTAPVWAPASGTTVGTSTQVNTVLQTASNAYYLTFVDSNNAVSTAEAVYTTSTFTINPATGFVGIGSQDGASPLNVKALSTLSGTINSFQKVLTTQASGGLGNNVYRSEWRRRRAAGTDWTTQNIHDGIWVDGSFITPGTDTRTWWDRDPNTPSQAWGDQATTWMFVNGTGLGIGTTSPVSKLTNIATNTGDAAGLTAGAPAIQWQTSIQGYTLAITNSGAGSQYANGLLVKTTGVTDTLDAIVNFESGGVNRLKLTGAGNLVIGGYLPTNTSRLFVRGTSPGSYNNTFSISSATVQIVSNEMNNDGWNPTLNIATVRQSLTTGANSFGGIGFSTIDDSNNAGMYDAARIAIINESPSTVASPTAMAFYTQVGSVTPTNAATERMRITSLGGISFGASGTAYGSNGQILQSNGNAAPTWVPVSGTTVGTSTQVTTVLRTTAAEHFLTFVDSNNAAATAESVYTTSSFKINPQSGNVMIGTGTPGAPLSFTDSLTTKIQLNANAANSYTIGKAAGVNSGDSMTKFVAGATSAGEFGFYNTTNLRLLINNNGAVLINRSAQVGTTRLHVTGGTNTVEYVARLHKGNYLDTGGHTTLLGFGCEDSGWSKTAIGHTRTSSYDTGYFGIYVSNDTTTGTDASTSTHRRVRVDASGVEITNALGVGTGASGVAGEIRATNEITAYYSSDIRLKENIRLIADPITIVNQIRGVYYDWTDEHITARGGEDGYFVRKHDIGVIAQEVEAVLPEIVATRDDGTKVVKYEKLVALLIEAVKDQQRQINQISQALQNLAIK